MNKLKSLNYSCALLLLFCVELYSQESAFAQTIISDGWLTRDVKVDLVVDDIVVAYIGYTQLPLSYYIIHSFYTYPQFRAHGHGKKLLAHCCALLQGAQARKVFIQPGPFELVDGRMVEIDCEEENIALAKLVRLYGSVGFKPVSWLTVKATQLLYMILSIDEYPEYLMSMTR